MIAINNLSRSFGKKKVLKSINLEVYPGEVVALLGRNGAGKSTLLNILSNLVHPESGSVSFEGKSFKKEARLIYRQLGIQSQYDTLIEELSGYNLLRFTGMIYDMEKPDIDSRIESLAGYFLISETDLSKPVGSYSSGMKKKMKLCSALLHRPKYLLLDEPFANIDPVFSDLLCKLINRYQNENRIILFASHDLLYVDKIATRICFIEDGRITADTSLSSFKADLTMENAFLKNTDRPEDSDHFLTRIIS